MNRNEKGVSTLQAAMKKACRSRLRRIEGQVRGLLKMIDDDRYCIEVIDQVQAVAAAQKKVEREILNDHISHCVKESGSDTISGT